MFDLQPGLTLALFPRRDIARDANVSVSVPSAAEFVLAHNLATKADVDAVMEQARKAGAATADPARDRFWGGYSGYFQDPDGDLWEAAWNPQMELEE